MMNTLGEAAKALEQNGFSVVSNSYSEDEIQRILATIERADTTNDTFRKSADLFAIRQFLKEIPQLVEQIFTDKFKQIVQAVLGEQAFVVKSIYFDKPETSNWYVAYHQDLTISVNKKVELPNFGPWTTKQNQFAVQPPTEILENMLTLRIHLDDTNAYNGALRVIPQSHLKQIYRPETIDWSKESEVTCEVNRGGVMLMKPLTLHSSSRTTNQQRRRVIHIEFSTEALPSAIEWAERMPLT